MGIHILSTDSIPKIAGWGGGSLSLNFLYMRKYFHYLWVFVVMPAESHSVCKSSFPHEEHDKIRGKKKRRIYIDFVIVSYLANFHFL
jgi:hypothetical protein